MSRSYKKNSFCGNTVSESEKNDKKFAHRRLRRINKKIGFEMDEDVDIIYKDIRDVSDIWLFDKDGKQYFGKMKYDTDEFYVDLYKKLKRK